MAESYLTVDQVATRLQMHPFTIRRQLQSGRLRGIKRGRVWRVPESAIEESSPPPTASPALRRWEEAAERMAPVYAAALVGDDDLTVATTAPGDFYDPGDEGGAA